MLPKVSYTWLSSSTDSGFDSSVQSIIEGLTGNADFPNPAPTLAVVQAAYDVFKADFAAARNGGKAATVAKNNSRAALEGIMRDLGQYIEETAAGDLEKLLGTNYPLQKERSNSVGIQPAPTNLRLKHGKVSGSISAACETDGVRVMVDWQTAAGQVPGEFTSALSTNSLRTTFSGLTPGTWLNARCRARVPAGAGDWSNVVQIMVI
jgi:hypothetical protein